MDIDVIRYNTTDTHTDGLFLINGEFMCFTLEDEKRAVKVKHETRIPNGRYKVELRTEGGFNARYLKQYGANFHKGMLWVKDVPNFEWILIHKGNTQDHTSGCLLVGMNQNADARDFVGESGKAYEKIYPIVRDALLNKEVVYINYMDIHDKIF